MFPLTQDLIAQKEQELQRALHSADAEVVGSDLALEHLRHPLTGESGYTLPLTETVAGANLGIVQHANSRCIQFIFPVQGAQPVPAQTPAAPDYQFGFIRPRQLGPAVQAPTPWRLKAALQIGPAFAQEMAEAVERMHKAEALIDLSTGMRQAVTPAKLRQSSGQRVLLFIHGIFSSIGGAFGALASPTSAADGSTAAALLPELLTRYQGRVFGYDHWTIAKTPLQNACDLLDALPAGANWDVDLVCHSRGGLLVRALLAEAAAGIRLANEELAGMAARRAGKIRQVEKVFFVAAANQGSQLAEPDDVRNFLNVAALLASLTDCMALDVVIGLARWVVAAGFDLPSVQALASGSSLIADLGKTGSLLRNDDCHYARADFDYATSRLYESAVYIDRYLMQADNDLVVPYAGVTLPGDADAPDERMLAFGTPAQKQHEVWHTEFFKQYRMQQFLRAALLPA